MHIHIHNLPCNKPSWPDWVYAQSFHTSQVFGCWSNTVALQPKRKVQRTWMTSWRAFTVFTKACVRPAKSMGSLIFIANESSFLDPLYRVGCKRIEKEWELFPYIFIPWNPVKGSIFRPSHALHWQTLGGLIRLLNWGHGSKLPTSKSCSGGLHWRQRSLQIRTPRTLVLSYCLD